MELNFTLTSKKLIQLGKRSTMNKADWNIMSSAIIKNAIPKKRVECCINLIFGDNSVKYRLNVTKMSNNPTPRSVGDFTE
jgi:hypothetical protein